MLKIPKFLKLKRTYVILAVVILVAVGAGRIAFLRNAKSVSSIIEGTVERRDITETVVGKATLMPKDEYDITSLVTGDVISASFEDGDIVEKGDVLYKIDANDVEKSIDSANVAIDRANLNYNDAVKAKNDLSVVSDKSGIVKKLHVKEGDMVQAGSPVADIYDDSYMELYIPFNESEVGGIYSGQSAVVTVSNTGTVLYGTVTSINNASETKDGYMIVRNVKIRVQNPGAITQNDTATAMIGNIASNDSGKFKYITEKTVISKGSGEVKSINIKEGNRVSAGSAIVTLENDSLDSQITSSRLSIDDARISKDRAYSQLDNYTITAPISGTVIKKNIKAGDSIDASKMAAEPLAVIYDLSSLKFDMDVDELDINKVEIGQEVTISVDALPNKEYKGMVEKINIDGVTADGVTNYPVTVVITEFDDDLLPGMNIDATIIVNKAKDVLSVPIYSINREDVVYVKGAKTAKDDVAPEGYRSVIVETGINDDEYIEIRSGLKEGDIVYVGEKEKEKSQYEQMIEMRDASMKKMAE